MKQLISLIAVIVVIIAGFMIFSVRQKSKAIDEARSTELSGDLEKAVTLYGALIVKRIPTLKIPDINTSKYLAPDELKKDVAAYFAWLSTPSAKTAPDVATALSGLARCDAHSRNDNFLIDTTVRPLSVEQFSEEWNKTFFAPNVKIDPAHQVLASGNYLRKFSLLTLKSGQSYTYDLCLVNLTNHRATSCVLLPENSVRLYAAPGTYLLLCRSRVTFSSGEVWFSHYSPIRITIPEEPSMIIHQIRTAVPRKK